MDFRKFENTVTKLENPTNLTRAKSLGYKAKKGLFTAVVRVHRGGGLFRPEHNGRRPKRMGFKKLTRNLSIQRIAEMRAVNKYINCEVINSYFVGEDGKYKYYEIILASKNQPELIKDKILKKIIKINGRANRGLTSAGKKGRSLRKIRQTTKK
jgi:large subunit ribosomal protein L15e